MSAIILDPPLPFVVVRRVEDVDMAGPRLPRSFPGPLATPGCHIALGLLSWEGALQRLAPGLSTHNGCQESDVRQVRLLHSSVPG